MYSKVRKVRSVIVLLIAVLFGIIAAKWVYWTINKPRVSEVKLVAASSDIEAGETLVKDKLKMITWPDDKVPSGSFFRMEEVIGGKSGSLIYQGELVNKKRLETKRSKGFSGGIEFGMRAISIKVDEVSGISHRELKKGDRVDIVATNDLPEKGKISRVILTEAEVMGVALDKQKKGKKAASKKSWTVTLMIKDVDIPPLSAACEGSRIRLVLRNPGDHEKTELGEALFAPGKGMISNFDLPEIRKGKRAITIVTKDTDGICGYLCPGDRVDVIVTCPISKFASGGNISPGAQGKVTEYQMSSRTLLQNVEVLATEHLFGGKNEIKSPVKKVTLLVSPKEVEKISVISDATSKSIIRLVSRNPEDKQVVKTRGQKLADLITQKREVSRVELIKGTEWRQRAFYK